MSVFGSRSLVLAGCLSVLATTMLSLGPVAVSPAGAALPTGTHAWWHLEASATPTNLDPGGEGQIAVTARNLGDEAVNGAAQAVTIADALPAGLRASASAISGEFVTANQVAGAVTCTLASLSCTFGGTLEPYGRLRIKITMKEVPADAPSGEENVVTVEGGGAPPAFLRRSIAVSPAATPFGVEDYELRPEAEDGSPATQAGAHPFQLTTTIALNRKAEISEASAARGFAPQEAGLVKDLNFRWPSGLIGNPTAFPRCTAREFSRVGAESVNACPPDTAMGVVSIVLNEPFTLGVLEEDVPLFNLEPETGEPARFGFEVDGALVFIDTSIRTGGDYGVTVSGHDITQLVGFLSATVTVWGVPGDPRHNPERGWPCLRPSADPSGCTALAEAKPPPFLTLPTSCTGPLQTTLEADSWEQPSDVLTVPASVTMPALGGCERLPFAPEIGVAPDGQQASSPTGLSTDVHVPQEGQLNPTGLASSDIRDIAVTLPEGVTLNPAGANGLQACSESLIGYLPGESDPPSELRFTSKLPDPLEPGVDFCPNAAKIGTAKITTPLLANPLVGAVYLAAQNENPFGSLVAMYLVAEDPVSGSLVKLPGQVALNQQTGQIVATFENTPQLAFEDAELHFFGGEDAPLSTPAHCGVYTADASFTPWAGGEAVSSRASFQIASGPGGGPCPGASLPFAPSLQAGTANVQAGAFSALGLTVGREDGEQNIQSLTLHMPPGLLGLVASVEPCPTAQAEAGTCGPASRIGQTTVSVGLGGNPYTVTGGEVFLSEGYGGAPYGLSIVTPAVAGPFDLGKVVVRAKIEVDPLTAALTVTTSSPSEGYAIPHILDGIPLQIKHIDVSIDRGGFIFNPTSCAALKLEASLESVEGTDAPTTPAPFEVANCATLGFAPKLTVTAGGRTSRADGAGLAFKIVYPRGAMGSQAWFKSAKFVIPKQLPVRLTTLRQGCAEATFVAGPANCPKASRIGTAVVSTPVLPGGLAGTVYFVSNGGAKFPEVVIVLEGDDVKVDLHGETFVGAKTGITSATFHALPDVPFDSIEVKLPTGPNSEFAAVGDLCRQKLSLTSTLDSQNGLELHEVTRIGVTGCPKSRALTEAQKLKRSLKTCRKKKDKRRRTVCERTARRRYKAASARRIAKRGGMK